jgi:hypothetical protein
MKISQLKEVIRAKVRETLYTGPNAVAAVKNDAVYNALPPIEKTKVNVALQKKQSVNLEEEDQVKPGQVDTKTLKNVKLKNGAIYKNVRFHMLNDPKSFVKSDGGYMINQDIASVVDANQELKENGEYTVSRIRKMNRAELIDFIDPKRELSHVNRSTDQLRGDALEMADDRPDYEETNNSSIDESGTGDQPISSMSRADLLKHFKLDPNTSEKEISTEYLRDAMSGLDEADYIDDDDTVHEGVDDDNTDFKDYDSVYEDMEDTSPNVDKYKLGEIERNNEFRANVGSGHHGLSVKLHPMDSRLLMISQDNGQRVVVEIEDIPELTNTLKNLA